MVPPSSEISMSSTSVRTWTVGAAAVAVASAAPDLAALTAGDEPSPAAAAREADGGPASEVDCPSQEEAGACGTVAPRPDPSSPAGPGWRAASRAGAGWVLP